MVRRKEEKRRWGNTGTRRSGGGRDIGRKDKLTNSEGKDCHWKECLEHIFTVCTKSRRDFEKVMGAHGFGVRNQEGERILELCKSKELRVINTMFKNRPVLRARSYCCLIFMQSIKLSVY